MCSTPIYLGRLDSTQVGAIVLSDGSFYSQKLANSIFGAVILPSPYRTVAILPS